MSIVGLQSTNVYWAVIITITIIIIILNPYGKAMRKYGRAHDL